MNIVEMWLKCVSGTLCRSTCTECHDITNDNSCPMDIAIKDSDMYSFIQRVTETLHSRQKEYDNMPFGPWEISEDEFIEILKECGHD